MKFLTKMGGNNTESPTTNPTTNLPSATGILHKKIKKPNPLISNNVIQLLYL